MPTGYWTFTVQANTPPTISLSTPPSSLSDQSPYIISWTMNDSETPQTLLVVYLNYTYDGETYVIVQHLVGQETYEWTLPSGNKNGIRINATIIDQDRMRNWSQTPEFNIVHVTPPSNDTDDPFLVYILLLAIIILTSAFLSIFILGRRKKYETLMKNKEKNHLLRQSKSYQFQQSSEEKTNNNEK